MVMFRAPCIARVHQTDGRPTLEGVLVQRRPHYVLDRPKLLEGEDRTIELDGHVEVLREHVSFVQLLAKAA